MDALDSFFNIEKTTSNTSLKVSRYCKLQCFIDICVALVKKYVKPWKTHDVSLRGNDAWLFGNSNNHDKVAKLKKFFSRATYRGISRVRHHVKQNENMACCLEIILWLVAWSVLKIQR